MQTKAEPPHRILILKMSCIGDVVMAMPVATALKRAFRDVWIAWAAQPPAAEILIGHPAIDEVVEVPPKPGDRWPHAVWVREWLRLAPSLRKRRFDVAMDMQGHLKAALLGVIARVPKRLGFADEHREFNRWLNNIPVDGMDTHVVERHLQMANALGAKPYPVDFALQPSVQVQTHIDEIFESEGLLQEPPVALLPFASETHKRWPAERFAQLAARLTRHGLRCVIVGGKGDVPAAREIVDAAGDGVISLAGRTKLRQLAALLQRCRLVIGNDTGPLHIAAAVGTPVLGLYGPTDPAKVGPYGWIDRVLWHRQPCGPCGHRPTCRDCACMNAISVDEVVARAAEMIRVNLSE